MLSTTCVKNDLDFQKLIQDRDDIIWANEQVIDEQQARIAQLEVQVTKMCIQTNWLNRLIEKIDSDENIKAAWNEFLAFYDLCEE